MATQKVWNATLKQYVNLEVDLSTEQEQNAESDAFVSEVGRPSLDRRAQTEETGAPEARHQPGLFQLAHELCQGSRVLPSLESPLQDLAR